VHSSRGSTCASFIPWFALTLCITPTSRQLEARGRIPKLARICSRYLRDRSGWQDHKYEAHQDALLHVAPAAQLVRHYPKTQWSRPHPTEWPSSDVMRWAINDYFMVRCVSKRCEWTNVSAYFRCDSLLLNHLVSVVGHTRHSPAHGRHHPPASSIVAHAAGSVTLLRESGSSDPSSLGAIRVFAKTFQRWSIASAN